VTESLISAAREGSQQTLAQVVIETLGEVQGRDGDRAAYQDIKLANAKSQYMQ
jgi:hypothetical protein